MQRWEHKHELLSSFCSALLLPRAQKSLTLIPSDSMPQCLPWDNTYAWAPGRHVQVQ